MPQNTPPLNSNIYFEPPRLLGGGGLGGSKSRFDLGRGFFAPNQKVQKTKHVFIGPINTTAPLTSRNFEVDTLSPPSIYIQAQKLWVGQGGWMGLEISNCTSAISNALSNVPQTIISIYNNNN